MVTLKRKKTGSARVVAFFVAFCMLAVTPAQSQTAVDATILSTNLNAQSKQLYVEMSYTPKICGSYQLRFRLETKKGTTYTGIELDSVISNNHGTQKISTYTDNGEVFNVLNLDNTAVGGYNLRFALKGAMANITAADSPVVCLETYRIAYRCRWCGVNRSDILFTPRDLDPQCPYTGDDLVACGRRVGGAKNWEAYVQDPRDCRIYRVVQMPDGKWWFAQNLNYQDGLTPSEGAGRSGNTFPYFYCPGPNGRVTSLALEDGLSNETKWSCEVYGALYPWYTASRLDGSGGSHQATAIGASTATSSIRGICPPTWYLPNDADWGIMLNSVEGCAAPEIPSRDVSPLNPPCNHFLLPSTQTAIAESVPGRVGGETSNAATGLLGNMQMEGVNPTNATIYYYNLGYQAGKVLKATPTCPGGAICDNLADNNPAGTFGLFAQNNSDGTQKFRYAFTRWVYAGKEASGSDRFGFSVLPAGFRSSQGTGDNVSIFVGRGQYAIFLSSSYYSSSSVSPVLRGFFYDATEVKRFYGSASNPSLYHAYSVRCMKK
jgi:uncharacterized protein (TIGR02145 family)